MGKLFTRERKRRLLVLFLCRHVLHFTKSREVKKKGREKRLWKGEWRIINTEIRISHNYTYVRCSPTKGKKRNPLFFKSVSEEEQRNFSIILVFGAKPMKWGVVYFVFILSINGGGGKEKLLW